ncbi:MAG: hypothetical protein ABIO92_08400 [Chloroflexia bacterium]
MYRTERILILTSVLFVGLGLTLAVTRGVLGSENEGLGILVWLLTLLLTVIAGIGAFWLRSGIPIAGSTTLSQSYLPFVRVPLIIVVPTVLVVGFVIFLRLFDSGVLQAVVLTLAALSFASVFWAQAHSVNWRDRYFGLAQAVLNLLSHLAAFLFFSVIYGLKVRALYSATAVGIVTCLLMYEMLSRDATWHRAMGLPVEGRRTTLALLSIAAGLVAGEITWGLNYWAALSTLVGGAFLLLVFYVIYGVVSHYVERTVTPSIFVEFGAVAALGVGVILASAFLT